MHFVLCSPKLRKGSPHRGTLLISAIVCSCIYYLDSTASGGLSTAASPRSVALGDQKVAKSFTSPVLTSSGRTRDAYPSVMMRSLDPAIWSLWTPSLSAFGRKRSDAETGDNDSLTLDRQSSEATDTRQQSSRVRWLWHVLA